MRPGRQIFATALCVFGLALGPGCDPLVMTLDDDPLSTAPDFDLQPTTLEYGEVAAGAPRGQGLRLFNHGTRPFRVLDVELFGDSSWHLESTPAGEEIAPGESLPLEVWFDPLVDGPHTAAVLVTTDLAGQRQALLFAQGLAPRVVIDPPSLRFEDVAVGCSAELGFEIHNAGTQPLTISGVELLRKSAEIDLASHLWLPAVVLPGEFTWLSVAYRPVDDAVDLASIVVQTDAPAAADEVIPIDAAAVYPVPVQEEFVQRGNLQADVLWVVDDAPGMKFAQQAAGLAAWSYIADLDEKMVDFQLGVISTHSPVLVGDVPVLTQQTSNLPTTFAGALQVGTRQGEPTPGLATALEAVSPPLTDPDGPNHGFLRDDSLLQVVFLSERDDASPADVLDYVLGLQELRADPDRLVIGGIGAFPQCAEIPAIRYDDAIGLTGGVQVCLQDLVADPLGAVQALADDAARMRDTFPLEGQPLDGIDTVHVDGVLQLGGWSYDAVARSIHFDPPHVPDNDQLIAVHYRPAVCD